MCIKLNARIVKASLWFMLGGIILFVCFGAGSSPTVHAQTAGTPEPNNYYTVNLVALSDGTVIEEAIINGPPTPPAGFDLERQAVSLPEPDNAAGINVLTVPAFDWVFGCSAVSGAMIAGYYDRSGWPNIYTGPTNGGFMPLNNSSWPTWSDGTSTYPSCPLIASKNGVDGRATRGSIEDYWVQYGSYASDPYITNGWTQHTWGTAIGDYMKTSRSTYASPDGSTWFWNYTSASRLTCAEMASNGLPDGTLGRKLFYEARGYTVTDCYNQKTDNIVAKGFSFAQFKAEIDAGRPVMLNLYGHTVVGIGYNDATKLIYIHDTWDYGTHTMIWGGSYVGMELQSVSIVNLKGTIATYTISGNAGMGGATLSYTDGVSKTATADDSGLYSFVVSSGWSGVVTPSKTGYTFLPVSKSYTDVITNQTAQNYVATDGIVIGGAGDDVGKDIAVDGDGNTYVAGYSTAAWGTPIRAYNGGTDGNDTFVAKLDSSGNLVWNTFLRTSKGWYETYSIGVDGSRNIYLLGVDSSANTYLAKINANGTLLWNITVAGGSFWPDMAVTANGSIYVAGSSVTAYAIKMDTDGNQLWNTSLGRSDNDCKTGIAVDSSGNAYVTSCSHEVGYLDAFVTKLDTNGGLIWNTFLGGTGSSMYGSDITADASGNTHVIGRSYTTWGAPIQPYSDGAPYFIAQLDQSGDPQWNTFTDLPGNDMAPDASGKVHIAGTDSGATLDVNGNFSRYPLLQGAGITTDNNNVYTVGSLGDNPRDILVRKISLQHDIFLPSVASSLRADTNPTSASSVDFIVTFSEFVTGVDMSDFKLTNTLLTSASITGISGSGMGPYTVTVNTGTGNGTIRLDVPATASIQDLDGNAFVHPYTDGQFYTVDKGSAPTVPVLVSPANGALVAGYKPTLDWGDSSPVMALANNWSYEVNVTDGLGSYGQTFNTASGLSNSSYTFTDSLPVSTTYTWKVRAYNDNNQYSAWSVARTFSTGSKLDTPVLNLPADGTTESNKRPTFSWDVIPSAATYTLQILQADKVVITGTIKAPVHTYTPVVDLLPDTTYQWKVRANNGVNSGEYSASFTFKTSVNPPKIPVLTSPAAGALVDSVVIQTLVWSITTPASPIAASYEVEYATNGAFIGSTVVPLAGTQLPLSIGTLLPNRTYSWHVRSWSGASATGNHSAWSVTRTFRTMLSTPELNLPPNSAMTALDNKRPTFSWDEVPGALTYTLQILNGTKVVNTGTIKAPAYTYTPSVDLLPGTTYQWKVKANGTNAGIYSVPFTFITSGNPPKVPVLLAPANAVLVNSAVAQTLGWNPVLAAVTTSSVTTYPAAGSYEVEYAMNSFFSGASDKLGVVNSNVGTQLSIVTLPGRTYYWRVRSWSEADAKGNHSAWSLARTINVKFAAPMLDPVVVTSGSPALTWHSENGLWTNYTLTIINSTTNKVVKSFTVPAPTMTYTVPAASLPTGTYRWQVKINGLYTPISSAISVDTIIK